MVKILTAIGSLVLLVVAFQHMQSVDVVKSITIDVDNVLIKSSIVPLWVLAAVQLLFVALMAFGASFYRSKACAAFLLGFGLWVLVDAAILWTYNGWFTAIPMLLAAGLLYLVAGLVLRRAAHAS